MPPREELTEGEMEVVTMVFKQYETGLREACITSKVGRKYQGNCNICVNPLSFREEGGFQILKEP